MNESKNNNNNSLYDNFLEIKLSPNANSRSFWKVKEALSRIGVAVDNDKRLIQSCHILHRQGRYYLVHFLEMFMLDGKRDSIAEYDIARRNLIASMLQEWGLITTDLKLDSPMAKKGSVRMVPRNSDWRLVQKYTIGKHKHGVPKWTS